MVQQLVHFLSLTCIYWRRNLSDLNERLKSNRILPICSFMMHLKRKRITMDLKSPIEEAFFARLEQKEWPSLMRLILRDAIRTGRAQELKHEHCFHFDETPLIHEGVHLSDDGQAGGTSDSNKLASEGKPSFGSLEADLLKAFPDQDQPASLAGHVAAPDEKESQISPAGATRMTSARLGKAASSSATSSAEAMEFMNSKIKEVRDASGEATQAQAADWLTVRKTPLTQVESAAGASPTLHDHLSGDASSQMASASNTPHGHSSVAPVQASNAVPPEVQPGLQAPADTHQSPAEARSASFLKGFFGDASRDRLL